MMLFFTLLSIISLFVTVSSSESVVGAEKKTAESDKKGATESSPFTALLGETLYKWKINADNTMEVEELSTVDLLKGKTAIAIYFSASWCGPCKKFTPVLAQLYKTLNKKGKKFEVVWLSRDRTSEEFLGYYQQMPWLAVPLQNLQPVLEKIAPMYQLKGIPHLVILDGDDATLITLEGTNAVVKDQYGLEYPWRARSLMNMLPKPLKRILKSKINQVVAISQGMLEGIAPRRVLGWMKVQVINLLSAAKVQAVAFIKEKAAKKNRPTAEVGQANDASKSKSSQEKKGLVGALSVSGDGSDEDSDL